MENIQPVQNEVTLESAKFIFDQAQKRLQAAIELASVLTDKAVHVMQFSVPLSIALISLIVIDPKKEWLWFFVAILVMSITISYISVLVYELHDVKLNGYTPSELLNTISEGEDQHAALVLDAIKDLEGRIDVANRENHERVLLLSYAVLLVKALILVSCVLFATGFLIPMI